MKVVINIPDAIYERFGYEYSEQHLISKDVNEAILDAFCNGTPLPKGHGRLGDLDRLYKVFERNVVGASAFKDLFDTAPTIIEADAGENRMTWKEAIKFCEEHECEECPAFFEDKRTDYQTKVLHYHCCWNLVDKENKNDKNQQENI